MIGAVGVDNALRFTLPIGVALVLWWTRALADVADLTRYGTPATRTGVTRVRYNGFFS